MPGRSSEGWGMERADSMAHPAESHAGQGIHQPGCMAEPARRQLGVKVGIAFRQTRRYAPAVNRISARRMLNFAAHMCRRYL